VYSNDIDRDSAATYSLNFGSEVDLRSIATLDPNELPDFDLFCGGFPCQPFSIAGKRAATNDERGQLFEHIVRIVRTKEPRYILLENVANLVSIEKGAVLRGYIAALEELGYQVHTEILDSAHYGVPQKRKRLFIVAMRNEDAHVRFLFPMKSGKPVAVRTVIANDEPKNALGPKWKHYVDFYTGKTTSDELPFALPKTRRTIERQDQHADLEDCIFLLRSSGVRAISLDRPYPTLAVSISGGGAMVPIYSKDQRYLSVLELQRIMGFPDDYRFEVSRTAAIKALSNSVCPPVIKAIGKSIAKHSSTVMLHPI